MERKRGERQGSSYGGTGVAGVKRNNQLNVLRAIVENPVVSRGELARITGMSKMSMTNIIGELMQKGIVQEMGRGKNTTAALGRRPSYLDLAGGSPCVMGVCISRQGIQVAVGDLRAQVLQNAAYAFPQKMDQEALVHMIREAIRRQCGGLERPVLGVCIAAIGPVSIRQGAILAPANFYGMHNIPIVEAVGRGAGLPVLLTSQSAAGAQGEKLFGAGRAHSNFLFLSIGEDIGCGIIADGKPCAGEWGVAGELGHMSICYDGPPCGCGGRGCLALYANARRMIQCMQGSLQKTENLQHGDIWRMAWAGDAQALLACEQYCDYLACALTNVVRMFSPEAIYLCQQGGEDIAELMGSLLQQSMQARMPDFDGRQIELRRATFGTQAVLKGALASVVAQIYSGSILLSGNL